MITPNQKAVIADINALYYGYPIEKLMERAGQGIAIELVKKYGRYRRIAFICGPGNNGGDGFAAARYLAGQAAAEIYLVGNESEIRTPETKKNWTKWQGFKRENATAEDIPLAADILVECLFGTGIRGKLRQPYASIVKKMNQFKGPKVSIDMPAPGFKSDFVISMMIEKVPGAAVVDIGYPAQLAEKTGIGEVKVLHRPSETSHKGDNGKLLIIGGNEQYHGAPLYATKIASKIVDLIYFSSVPENNALVQKMKSKSCEFITIPQNEINEYASKVDVILIGPGLGLRDDHRSSRSDRGAGALHRSSRGEMIHELLRQYPHKKFVLDADALKLVNPKLLNPNCIVTPHANEFKALFGIKATKASVLKMADKYDCILVLKGKKDYVSDGHELKVNETGNAGMTKGGTGDVLAGLTAALACKNDPFLAARAAVFLNGLAGNRLKEKVSYYYNASDLICEIPKALKWCALF